MDNQNLITTASVSYTYSDSGICTVTHHVTLTNVTSEVYAHSYELILTGEFPKNITVSDSVGPLKFSTAVNPELSTVINIVLSRPALGKNKSVSLTISYTGDPATHTGRAWDIVIPHQSSDLVLSVPTSFGMPINFSAAPTNQINSPAKTQYYFSKPLTGSLTASFGDSHIYSFYITRRLSPSDKLTLPADTATQQVYFDPFLPPPQAVTPDASGNWQASYTIPAGSFLDATVSGQIHTLTENPPANLFAATPSAYRPFVDPKPEVQLIYPSQFFPFLSSHLTLSITNPGPSVIRNLPISVSSTPISAIPPYGRVNLTIDFPANSKLIPVTVGTSTLNYNIPERLFLCWYVTLTLIITIIVISLAGLAHHAWSLHLQKSRRQHPVRR